MIFSETKAKYVYQRFSLSLLYFSAIYQLEDMLHMKTKQNILMIFVFIFHVPYQHIIQKPTGAIVFKIRGFLINDKQKDDSCDFFHFFFFYFIHFTK